MFVKISRIKSQNPIPVWSSIINLTEEQCQYVKDNCCKSKNGYRIRKDMPLAISHLNPDNTEDERYTMLLLEIFMDKHHRIFFSFDETEINKENKLISLC